MSGKININRRCATAILVVAFAFGADSSNASVRGGNGKTCQQLFGNEFGGERDLPNPFGPWLHGTPFGAQVERREPKQQHAMMMGRSYFDDILAQRQRLRPIETGYIELLDSGGRVLDQTEIIDGEESKISPLNTRAIDLILENLYRIGDIKMVRLGHTHPRDFANQNLAVAAMKTHKFSPGDNRADADMRAFLDSLEFARHIIFESYIVYIDPNVSRIDFGNTDSLIKGLRIKARVLKPD